MPTAEFANYVDGQIIARINFNASTGRVNGLEVVNSAPDTFYAEVQDPADGTWYGKSFPSDPGKTQNQAVPGTWRIRLNADGELEVLNSVTGLYEQLPTRTRYPA